MLWKTRQITFNLTLNLCNDFVENWKKSYNTVVDVVTNPLLLVVINWALSLIILKTRDAFFWGSILTPNTRILSLIIMHRKPKVVNVLTKTWVKLVFYKKGLAKFFLYRNIFANSCIKNAQFNIFYQYMLLLTKVKQFSNLLKIKKKLLSFTWELGTN